MADETTRLFAAENGIRRPDRSDDHSAGHTGHAVFYPELSARARGRSVREIPAGVVYGDVDLHRGLRGLRRRIAPGQRQERAVRAEYPGGRRGADALGAEAL